MSCFRQCSGGLSPAFSFRLAAPSGAPGKCGSGRTHIASCCMRKGLVASVRRAQDAGEPPVCAVVVIHIFPTPFSGREAAA